MQRKDLGMGTQEACSSLSWELGGAIDGEEVIFQGISSLIHTK